MEDVTDTVFREVLMSVSEPDALNVVFTEFTSVDGLLDERGHDKVAQRLQVSASEQQLLQERNTKLVAQIWGNEPEKFHRVAQYLSSLNRFDGIDINMGCPVKKVVKKVSCSALIKFPELAKEIVLATKEGSNLPVSVKTRIGFNRVETEGWISELLRCKPAAISIHGRTQKQLSEGLADWNEIGKAIPLRNRLSPHTQIIGNGDVESHGQAMNHIKIQQLDGVMVGRGVFKNPWMFNQLAPGVDIEKRLRLLKKHIELYAATWGANKNYHILKRFFKIYLQEFPGAGRLRGYLMESQNYEEALELIKVHGDALKTLNHQFQR
ncbi:MAG: tRNA dihydrouridine synthase [Salinivirgaceae bacterium]